MTYNDLRPMFLSWLVHYRPLSESTVKQYNLLVGRLFADRDLSEIDTIELHDMLIEECELRNYAAGSSRIRLYAGCKMFCRFLFFNRLTTEDIADRIPYPKRERKKLANILTPLEVELLLNSPKISLITRTFLTFIYDTGCRVTAAVHTQMENLNLENGMVTLLEKGGKVRQLPLSSKTVQIIKEYIAGERPRIACAWLFCTRNGRTYHRRHVGDMIYRACNILGITKHITPHTFRHSRATHLINRGVPVAHVAALLGHEDIRLTFQTYCHIGAEDLREKIGG